MPQMDFDGLKRALLDRASDLLSQWLPEGKVFGNEFVCGSIAGEAGESFRFNIKKGYGQDFATGEPFGDLITVYAKHHNMGMLEAAKACAKLVGFGNGDWGRYESKGERGPTLPQPKPSETAVENRPEFYHQNLGEPSGIYAYHNQEGQVLQYVVRYDLPSGKKTFLPYTFIDGRWERKAYPEPRPLYGLNLLAAKPGKAVLLCEGEKACRSAGEIAGHVYVPITWQGGAKAFGKSDFSPLKGRNVLLWPDADEPGLAAMKGVGRILSPLCPQVKILDVSDYKNGWDAADALESGFTWERFKDWGKKRVSLFNPKERPISKPRVKVLGPVTEPRRAQVDLTHMQKWEACGLEVGKQGPAQDINNVGKILSSWPEFKNFLWFDDFHNRIFTTWGGKGVREWRDVDTLKLTATLQGEFGLRRMRKETVHDCIMLKSIENIRNEPKDWISGLHWDGESRIETFFHDSFRTVDDAYSRSLSKNFWISLVARAVRPGCKVDSMVILEGPQGQYKSTACSIIGGKWFSEINESVTSKDFYLVLSGKLLVEIADLDSFTRAEVNTIKKVITSQVDRYRAPYERGAQDHPRRCIFVGTTNEESYLRDHTGARRFWPIKIGKIDLERIEKQREQLYAEAHSLLLQGEKWFEMPCAETLAAQELRRQEDPWEAIVYEFLQGRQQVTIWEVASECLKFEKDRFSMRENWRLGRVLSTIGWYKKDKKIDGRAIKMWFKKE